MLSWQSAFSAGTTGTSVSRKDNPFGHHEDERPASKRATRDAVVRMTRLSTPELENLASRQGHHEESLLASQSAFAARDALEQLLGANKFTKSGGHAVGRHSPALKKRDVTRSIGSTGRLSPDSLGSAGAASGTGNSTFQAPPPNPRDVRPMSGLSPRGSDQGHMFGGIPETGGVPLTPLGDTAPDYFASRSQGTESDYHSGSASLLPSKAKALLQMHSYYSAGHRAHDNQRPRDYTVVGEYRPDRSTSGTSKLYRTRSVKPSRAPGSAEQLVVEGEGDRTGETERVLKVKQMVKMVLAGKGAAARAQLERSFRKADKDGSGALSFDELNFSLRHDFAVKGLTPGDMRRVFESMDEDGSGTVDAAEFVNAIDEVPLPELKHKSGFKTKPTPQYLKVRQSFQVWPMHFDLGILREEPRKGGDGRHRKRVSLTVRNVGYAEARFRVHVLDLLPGQWAEVEDRPRGLVAPGLRGKVVVAFGCDEAALRNPLHATISIETSDQVCTVPVVAQCSDGREEFDSIHEHLTMGSVTSKPSTALWSHEELESASLLSSKKYTARLARTSAGASATNETDSGPKLRAPPRSAP